MKRMTRIRSATWRRHSSSQRCASENRTTAATKSASSSALVLQTPNTTDAIASWARSAKTPQPRSWEPGLASISGRESLLPRLGVPVAVLRLVLDGPNARAHVLQYEREPAGQDEERSEDQDRLGDLARLQQLGGERTADRLEDDSLLWRDAVRDLVPEHPRFERREVLPRELQGA